MEYSVVYGFEYCIVEITVPVLFHFNMSTGILYTCRTTGPVVARDFFSLYMLFLYPKPALDKMVQIINASGINSTCCTNYNSV